MQDREPTVRSRTVGRTLAKAAEAHGLAGSDVARLLGYSPSWVSRFFSGKRGATKIEDVAAMMVICGIGRGETHELLLRLARNVHELSWWEEFGKRQPAELDMLADLEAEATTVTGFEISSIPPLLRTASYLHAWMHATSIIPNNEIDDRVTRCMRRQRIFNRTNPSAMFQFFIDERAVTSTELDASVMSDQVHHMLRLAVRPYIEIRIVTAGGLHGCHMPFQLMEFAERSPVLYLENLTSAAYLERRETIDSYRNVVAELHRRALSEAASREWLACVGHTLERSREPSDELPEFGAASNFPSTQCSEAGA